MPYKDAIQIKRAIFGTVGRLWTFRELRIEGIPTRRKRTHTTRFRMMSMRLNNSTELIFEPLGVFPLSIDEPSRAARIRRSCPDLGIEKEPAL